MTVTLDDRRDFHLVNYERVTRHGEGVEIGAGARQAMEDARRSFLALLDSDRDQFIYGVTTGAGEGARHRIAPEDQRAATRRVAESHRGAASFGGGDLPARAVRGIIFARLANFVGGHAKTRPVVAERIADLLDGPLPRVPLAGEVFAGEIVPLFRVVAPIDVSDLEEGEPMALINGSPCSAALVAEVALDSSRRLRLAEQVFALSIEALGAPLEAYDPALAALWGDPYEAAALQRFARLLDGASTTGRRPYQAPVSWRILPRVLGQAGRAVSTASEVAAISLRSVTDNPVYLLPDEAHPLGRAISTGGYHNASAYPAIDGVSGSWADLCALAERHTAKLHDGPVSLLPHHLASDTAPGASRTHLLCLSVAGFGEEARHQAARTFLPMSESGGFGGQNDVPSPIFLTYARHGRVAWCLDACLACLAASASQALWVTDREPAPALRPFLAGVRSFVDPGAPATGRDLGTEVEALTTALGEAAVDDTGAFGPFATAAAVD
jgi:histidine ammonia-lyase